MSGHQYLDLDHHQSIQNRAIIRNTGPPLSSSIHLDNNYSPFVVPQTTYSPHSQQYLQYHQNQEQDYSREYEENVQPEAGSSSQTICETPSRKRKMNIDLRKELENSTKTGKFDLYIAGRALHKAYESNQTGISDDVSAFLTKNAMDAPFPKLPDTVSLGMTPEASALLHGYGIVAQMALVVANRALAEIRNLRPSTEVMNMVTDAPYAVKSKFFYPSSDPFSGKFIDVKTMSLLDSSIATHVRLQNYLFEILGKSCTAQTDIQRFWIIPGERKYTYKNPSPFPKELYDQLQQLFLELFQFDYDELDYVEYKKEYSNLCFLRNFGSEESKKKKYEQMAGAKRTFMTSSFRAQLKNALKELRLATFVIAPGSSEGYFSRRKRNQAKSAFSKKGCNVKGTPGTDGDSGGMLLGEEDIDVEH